MGFFDRFRRKKGGRGTEPLPGGPEQEYAAAAATTGVSPAMHRAAVAGSNRAQMDLILSQIETLRIQYEAINSRLQNIERLVTEIRGFCR